MKKAVWITAFLQLIVTGVFMRFMPDTVVTHRDIFGRADNFGSKYTYLLMPLITIVMAAAMLGISQRIIKKARYSGNEKKTAEAVSNAKVVDIAALCIAAMQLVLQFISLKNAVSAGKVGADNFDDNGLGITSLMIGIMFVVLGNYLPKTKPNGAVGLRTSHSMYNDNTWRKSNTYGGKALMIAGLLTVVTALFAKPAVSVVMMLVYLTGAVIAACVYAKKVYDEEISLSVSEQTR
ncbi:MAG: SdpI family protein [Ruminococcus sp.]|nr:SdpI family protein [Ruminococcus sp.]